MKEIIKRTVDVNTKPPTVYYSLKTLPEADEHHMPLEDEELPKKTTQSLKYQKARAEYEKELDIEMEKYEKLGIVELKDPEKAIEKAYLYGFQDFIFTLYNSAKAPNILHALMLMSRHIDIQRKILWQLVVKFAKDPEWRKSLEKAQEEDQKVMQQIRSQLKPAFSK